MLKRKAMIPMAALMIMSTNINSFASDSDSVKADEYKEVKYKTAKVTPNQGLNVRKSAQIEDDNKLFAATIGTEFDIVGQENDWYKVELKDDEFGYVNSNYVEVNNKSLYVDEKRVNFREEANLDSNVFKVLTEGTELELIEESNEWLKIKVEDKVGYIFAEYVTDEKPVVEEVKETTTNVNTTTNTTTNSGNVNQNNNTQQTSKPQNNNTATTNKPQNNNTSSSTDKPQNNNTSSSTNKPQENENTTVNNSNKQAAVVNLAYAQIGKPYVWGAEGPNSFDCSGLMQYIFRNGAGISLPRTSKQQSGVGTTVSRSNLQPGDLIFSSTDGSGSVSHVGVYVGNGYMIHAPKPGDVVQKTSINNSYWNSTYLWAKRVL